MTQKKDIPPDTGTAENTENTGTGNTRTYHEQKYIDNTLSYSEDRISVE